MIPGLVFAHLDTARHAEPPLCTELQAKLREWTLTGIRYKYPGRILEGPTLEAILAQARARGDLYCLVLSSGDVITEVYHPEHPEIDENVGFMTALGRLTDGEQFLVVADVFDGEDGPRVPSLLVDVERHRALGRPLVLPHDLPDNFPDDVDRRGFPAPVGQRILHVQPRSPEQAAALAGALGEALLRRSYDESVLTDDQRGFLALMRGEVGDARRGIFIFNFESYRDIEEPPADLAGPLSTVFSVTAGFKAYRLLATHGFDDATRVVFFDYSPEALEFKKYLHETWDGEDYPAFLRRAIARIPPSRAAYQFWGDLEPDDPNWDAAEKAWREELARWGGAEILRETWLRLRTLRYELVLANLLTDHGVLYGLLDGRRDPAIWWSNAFFTFFSNWHYDLAARRRIYEGWIDGLARRAPDLLLYGSDCNNISVNCIRAEEYRKRFAGGDDLVPVELYRHAIRF
jgi:hypothetical protein